MSDDLVDKMEKYVQELDNYLRQAIRDMDRDLEALKKDIHEVTVRFEAIKRLKPSKDLMERFGLKEPDHDAP